MTEEALLSLVRRAEARWPEFALDRHTFTSYLAERVGDDYGDAHPGDLYLACACAGGNAAAIAVFERDYLGIIRGAVGRIDLADDARDDVAATLREELIYGRGGRPPKLAQYSGRGSLKGWLRVTATRTALKSARRDRRIAGDDGVLDGVAASVAAPELIYIQKKYRDEFAAAFRDAMSRLSSRQRTLLRQKFVDGLTGDELAALYRVHRSTIVRRLAAARDAVLSHTRQSLVDRLDVAGSELDTILRAVRSQLEFSLASLLRSQAS